MSAEKALTASVDAAARTARRGLDARSAAALAAASLALMLAAWIGEAPACSLCGSVIKKNTLGQELDRAAVVLSGRVVGSRFNDAPGALPGSGVSDFVVDKVLKNEAGAMEVKRLEVPGAIPVLDAARPPRFVVFFDVVKGKLEPLVGRELRSDAQLEYLEQSHKARARKDRVAALLFYARYLDHADDAISEDAFMEFAKSEDAQVGEAARELDPSFFRKLIENPATPADRLSLYAFLLAGKKDASQADFLKNLIDNPTPRTREALDGILCGYIMLRPREGWDIVARLLADAKQPFTLRHAVIRTVRFYYNWRPKESRAEMLRAYKGLIETDLGDMAIDDLRRWKALEHTELIYKQFGRPGFDAPIIRTSILRYAAEAQQDVEARPATERFVQTLPEEERRRLREIENEFK